MQIAKNKTVQGNYEVLEELTAGIVLVGGEVKSLKAKHLNFKNAFVSIVNNEAWLKNLYITPYLQAQDRREPAITRRLLLTRQQIRHLDNNIQQKNYTVVPTAIFTKKGWIKVRLALAKGLKKHDKKQKLKERDLTREADRSLKHFSLKQ